jgi:zinc transport system ATP-binding protein
VTSAAAEDSGAVVHAQGIRFAYDTEPVLQDVDLHVSRGDFVCLVGPNGGGKTTLLKILLGLLSPDAGKLSVLGRSPAQARSQIGYVPQFNPFDPRFPIRVIDVVRMGRLRGAGAWWTHRRDDLAAAEEALAEVGLRELAGRSLAELSGGQRQRVFLARALVVSPSVLMLDEPTAGIDAVAEAEILDLLESLRGRMTTLLVTHNPAVVGRFMGRIICVDRQCHVHPPTDHVDAELMRHMCGYEIASPRPDSGRSA